MLGRESLVVGAAPPRYTRSRKVLLIVGGLFVLAAALGRLVFAELVVVRGNAMAPAVLDGDVLLVLRRARPRLGDVVLVEGEAGTVLRRVLAGPGDVVGTADGLFTRNEVPLETRIVGTFTYREPEGEGFGSRRQQHLVERLDAHRHHDVLGDFAGARRPWVLDVPGVEVPPGHFFVYCDNRRACALDDRSGPVPEARIHGVARYLMWYGDAREALPERRPLYGAFRALRSEVDEGEPGETEGGGAE